MVALYVNLPLGASTCLQNLPFCSSVQPIRLIYPRLAHRRCFAVYSISSTPSQVDQSSTSVEKFNRGNLVPLSQCIYSDHLTPVLAYRCLVNESDREAPSFLFESVESGFHSTVTVGRYSIVGANPALEIITKEYSATVINHREGWRTEERLEDPLTIPRTITEKWTPQLTDELPQVFCGGWVGYFSYDTVRYADKRLSFSGAPSDDINLPDVHLSLYDDVLVFDHVEKKIHAVHWVQLDKFSSIEEALDNGTNRLESFLSKIHDIVNPRLSSGSIESDARRLHPKLEVSCLTSEAYKTAILKAKQHMLEDGIHRVVLSQRFERRTFSDPFEVYRGLSIVDPNPFMAYMQVRGCIFVASSPQILSYVDKKGMFTNQTLSRTEGRFQSFSKDALLGKHLMNGQKHYAGDIGLANRVNCEAEKAANTYPTCWDALQDALSSEFFTGAPKFEAMELIDKLELRRRGPYGGSFGCISFAKDMDIALAPNAIMFPTRTAYDTLYSYKHDNQRREWAARLQAGASIMVDSDPEDKQRQCEQEAAMLARAIDLAESSFVHRDW